MKNIKVHLFTGTNNEKQVEALYKTLVNSVTNYEKANFLYTQSATPDTEIYNRVEFLKGLKEFSIEGRPLPNPFRNAWDDLSIR